MRKSALTVAQINADELTFVSISSGIGANIT